jgi:hypothetical protein
VATSPNAALIAGMPTSGGPGGGNPAALVAPLSPVVGTPPVLTASTGTRPSTVVGGTNSAAAEPTAIKPQEVRTTRRPVAKAAPTRILQDGDLICGDCGEGNAPSRRFCSRCGSSLAVAEKVHIPWWKRIFQRRRQPAGTKPGEAGAAGAKKKRAPLLSRILPTLRKALAVAILVGGIVYASVAPVRGWVNDRYSAVQAKALSVIHPEYVPVHPYQVTGSNALQGHPPTSASDGFTNTFWAAPKTGDPAIVLRFDHPTEVDRALIRIGVSGNLQATNRPHDIRLFFSTGKSQTLALDDKADPQEVAFKAGGKVTSIEIHITSIYEAGGSNDVAITEVELFAKK